MNPSPAPPRACLEVTPEPCVLVLFGATGDLARRKLIPSLYQMHARCLLHEASCVVGCGRTAHSDGSFRASVAEAMPDLRGDEADAFLARFRYVRVPDPPSFRSLATYLNRLDAVRTSSPLNRLFYFAVPQTTYEPILAALSGAGLLDESGRGGAWCHLLLEKPFGSDTASAAALDSFLQRHVTEEQLFRIDHYLGKDTVQNILMLRFANILFDPVWNASHIDHVQISVTETLGIEHRAAYYEQAGLVRDMFQNHLLEMLALVAMEPPAAYSAAAIHAPKLAVIRAIRRFPEANLASCVVRGQYVAGNGFPAYVAEPGVAPGSTIETFAAMRLWVDTPRWRGVPFYLRSGKRLASRGSRIALVFKPSPYRIFGEAAPDALVLHVQPDEGMSLVLQAKRPGPKLCMGAFPLSFRYADLGDGQDAPDAYARLLLDAMLHDHTLFVRHETIAAAWELFTPVLDVWRRDPGQCPLYPYAAGSNGPVAAHELLARDGRSWGFSDSGSRPA